MRREGRQIAKHRLLIADVGQDLVEETNAAARRGWHVQPGTREQRRESD